MQQIKDFIKKLLLGQDYSHLEWKTDSAIKKQWDNVKRVWRNECYKDFGLERVIRLTLVLSQFIFPGLYVRYASGNGKLGLLGRKLGVEFYVVIKLLLPILFFWLGLTSNIAVAMVSGYMAIETVAYLAALIYLSDEFSEPISYRRSLTTLFFNYIEVCLDYAVIYSFCNYAIPGFFKGGLANDMQAVYFSFVTSATVGYGDIVVENQFGQFLVITQIILFLLFVVLFINFFASKIQDSTYFNDKRSRQNHKKKEVDCSAAVLQSAPIEAVLRQAIQLSDHDRSVLVESLIISLDKSDPFLDVLWLKEAESRLLAYRSGELGAVDAKQVFAELGKRL